MEIRDPYARPAREWFPALRPADLKGEVVISVHPDGSEQLIETTLSAETLAELGRLNLALHIDITPFDR